MLLVSEQKFAEDSVRAGYSTLLPGSRDTKRFPLRLNKACAGRRANKSFRIVPIHSVLRGPPHSRVALHMSALHGYHGCPLASSSRESKNRRPEIPGPCVIIGNAHSAAVVRIRIPTAASAVPLLSLSLLLLSVFSTVKPLTTQHRRTDTLITSGRPPSAV